MFGLNADPVTDQSYTSLDYAWYATASGDLQIYENGGYVGTFGTYSTTDVLTVGYDGGTIRYLVNGVVKYSVATTANRSFHFDSSLNDTGFALNNIQFRPLAIESFYEYDAGGNRTRERTVKNGITYQDARTDYARSKSPWGTTPWAA